jgi:hypothetical protein
MKYDITKPQAPKMPNLGNGTECIKILLSQASKDMHEALVPMFFPVLGAHMGGTEFNKQSHLEGTMWSNIVRK